MTQKRNTSHPGLSSKGQDRLEDRMARRAEALRANLQRRKQQMRARAETDTKADEAAPTQGADPKDHQDG